MQKTLTEEENISYSKKNQTSDMMNILSQVFRVVLKQSILIENQNAGFLTTSVSSEQKCQSKNSDLVSEGYGAQTPAHTPISIELDAQGISPETIEKSLSWLKQFFSYDPDLYEKLNQSTLQNSLLHRSFAPQESLRIGKEGENFLIKLTFERVLSPARREFLLDCIMSEDIAPLSFPQLRFLTFVVLAQTSKSPEEIQWLEEIVLKQESELNTLAN